MVEKGEENKCTACGYLNHARDKYCAKCGNSLQVAAGVATPGLTEGGVPTPPQQQPHVGQAAGPPRPPSYPPPAAGVVREQAPVLPDRFREVGLLNRNAFLAGASIILVAGVVVFISTWLAWTSGTPGSLTGWDWFDVGRMSATGGGFTTPFLVSLEGYIVFTGLCSLLFGGLMIVAAASILVFRGRMMAWAAVFLSGTMLAMALIGMITMLIKQGAGIGAGLVLLLVFSAAAMAGAIVVLRNTQWAPRFPRLTHQSPLVFSR